jgi:hypothetical protein
MAAPQNFTARIASILYCDSCGNIVYVYPEGGLPYTLTCATNGPYVSFSMNRSMAKAYLSGLIMAQASGKLVTFRSEGACVDQSVFDTITYFQVAS